MFKVLFGFLVLLVPCSDFLVAGPKDSPRFSIETPQETRTAITLGKLDSLPPWIEMRQEGKTLPPLLTRDVLLFTTGDRIPLDPVKAATLDDNRLRFWPVRTTFLDAKALSVYAPNVAAVFWSLPDGVEDADRFFTELEAGARKRDVVFLKNGDRLEGTLIALQGNSGSTLMVGTKKVETPWSKLAGLAWSSERAVRAKTKKPYARAVLAGGARVSLADLRFDENARRWSGKTLFGLTFEFPEENLLAFDVRQDSAIDLSDLTPLRYENQPYLGAAWPLMRDAAATGQSLRFDGNTYEKGLGTHASCRVVYKLDGKFARFDALVGIDESARRGRAKVALELDGKRVELNEGREITHKDAALVVRQDVRKVRELTLIVELGTFGDVQAHVNWAKARLVR